MSETIDSTQKDGVYLCSFNCNHDSDNENDDQLVSDLNEKKRGRPKKNASKTQSESTYELSETFIPFQHAYPLHKAYSTLSNELKIQSLSIFLKFFTNKQMETIVKNTNIYAYAYGVKMGKSNSAGEGRNWIELTIQELKIWLALVIYMGIFKFSAVEDY